MRTFSLLVAGTVLAAAGLAQAPPVASATAEEVVLDVVLHDKKGKVVRDLGAKDFEVLDNGVARPVKSVRLIDTANSDPLLQTRLVTLVFEALDAESRRLAKQAAQDLVKSAPATNVLFSVFLINNRLSLLQEFTNDKEALKKAVEKVTAGLAPTAYIADSEALEQKVKAAAPALTDPAAKKANEVMQAVLSFDAAMSSDESTRMSIASLAALARGHMLMPGRKTVVYFTAGMSVPINLDEPFQNLLSAANRANVAFYPVDARGLTLQSDNRQAFDDLGSATDSVRSQLDTEREFKPSFVTKGDAQSSERGETATRGNDRIALTTLANSTGGVFTTNTNDLRGPLRRMLEDANAYYEITYDPQIQNYDGTFRRTAVSVTRPELKEVRLQARSGYFAVPLADVSSGVLPYEAPLLKALSTMPLPKELEFRAAAYRFQPTETGIREAFVVEVPMKNVTFHVDKEKNTYVARVSLIGLIKDASGNVVQKFARDLPLQGAADQVAAVQGANFTYKDQFSLPPGRYTVETAVMDREGNKIGARKAALVVTARASGVAMSSIALVRSYQPNAPGLDPEDPFQFQGGRITPSVSPVIHGGKGSQLAMFFVVYPNAAIAEKPEIVLEYIKDGNVIGRGEVPLPAADAKGRIPYVMSSSAEQMPPGNYEIRAIAKQGASTTEERTFITIE